MGGKTAYFHCQSLPGYTLADMGSENTLADMGSENQKMLSSPREHFIFSFQKENPDLRFSLNKKKVFTLTHVSVLLHGAVRKNEKVLTGTTVDGGTCECHINHPQNLLSRL